MVGKGFAGKGLKEQILDFVEDRGKITFVDLMKEFKDETGDLSYSLGHENVILWSGLSDEIFDALDSLIKDQELHFIPAPLGLYSTKGAELDLPITETVEKLTIPHWFPVLISVNSR